MCVGGGGFVLFLKVPLEVPDWLGYVCYMRGVPVAGRSLMEFVRGLENVRSVCRGE